MSGVRRGGGAVTDHVLAAICELRMLFLWDHSTSRGQDAREMCEMGLIVSWLADQCPGCVMVHGDCDACTIEKTCYHHLYHYNREDCALSYLYHAREAES
jgi:hypothetical protein